MSVVQVKTEAKTSNTSPEEFERIVQASQIRSARIRVVTIVLLLALTCVGAYFVVRQHEADVRTQKAQRDAEQAREQAKRARADAYIVSGADKAGRGNFKGALADYQKALAVDPNNAGALSLEGYLRLRMGDSQEAENLLRKGVQNEPKQPWNRYNLALALWANGKHDEAIDQIKEVLRLDPSFKQIIARDPQFGKFKSDPRFRELIKP
jgi:tetratricopeptide (TPR) repeat protein